MRTPFVRATVKQETATIADGHVLHTWDDLLGVLPGVIGVKTGHTDDAGWCQVAAVQEHGVTVYVAILGSPTRSIRNVGLESLLTWGVAQFRVVPEVQQSRVYATVALPYGKRPSTSSRRSRCRASCASAIRSRNASSRATSTSLPVRAGQVLGRVEIWANGHLLGSRPLIATRTVRRPGAAGRLGFYAGRMLHHIAHLF